MTPGLSRLGLGPVCALDPADVLPLPPVQFNHETGEKTIADAEMMAYARKMFSPLRHDQLVPDLPGLLRQAAAVLESRVRPAGGPAPDTADRATETQTGFQPALPCGRPAWRYAESGSGCRRMTPTGGGPEWATAAPLVALVSINTNLREHR